MKHIGKKAYLGLILLFLYTPIVVLIVQSFNAGKSRARWEGFSFRWYTELFHDQAIMDIDLEDAVLNGNEEMLSQVWLNLLDNAIKFTPDGGRIALQLTKKDKLAVITIQDNGVGIAADELERIFDKFYHSDAGSAAPGNGIGLTLARKIVRLHAEWSGCAGNR